MASHRIPLKERKTIHDHTRNRTNFRGGVLQHWTKTPATSDLTQLTQDIAELKQLIQTGITAVKSIQRGVTTEATTITIDAVNMNKAVVLSTSKKSDGWVPISASFSSSGSINEGGYRVGANNNPSPNFSAVLSYATNGHISGVKSDAEIPATLSQSGSIYSGQNGKFTVKEFSARLTSETTLECDGAVEWQVIEYN